MAAKPPPKRAVSARLPAHDVDAARVQHAALKDAAETLHATQVHLGAELERLNQEVLLAETGLVKLKESLAAATTKAKADAQAASSKTLRTLTDQQRRVSGLYDELLGRLNSVKNTLG